MSARQGLRRSDWGHPVAHEAIGGRVAIVGVGDADHSKASGRSAREIAAEAVERALDDAGLSPHDVDGICFSGGMGEAFDAKAFREHFGTRRELFESPRGGGMVWAATAPSIAAAALDSGTATHVVNVFSVSWATQRGEMVGGPGQFHAAERFKRNLEVPFGFFPQPVYFAAIARRHMHEFGTTQEQLGAIAVTCRRHANRHPGAIMREKKLALADYLARPMLVDPLRMEDCCLISDGGGAYVMTTPERARDLRRPPVLVEGVGEGHAASGPYWSQQADFTATPQVFSAPLAFEMAGIAPGDVDVLALYDPFTIVTLMQIEDMGFCAKGEGGAFVEGDGLFFDGGRLPTNTHGGLLSHAYVLGISHVVELVHQLRGEAACQVAEAEVAVYGGYTGAMASTLVLRRAP
jgi:acetyl-CoA acetyltransferase